MTLLDSPVYLSAVEDALTKHRRRFARYGTDLEVKIHQEDATYEGRIKQISRGGCLILPSLAPDLPAQVRVSFRLSEGLPAIHCKGEIAYSIVDKGTGIAFTEISEYSMDLITEHFEKDLATEKPSVS